MRPDTAHRNRTYREAWWPTWRRLVLVALAVGMTVRSDAETPVRLVPVTGVLTDANGQARTGAVTLTFRIYEAETGGAPLWTEVQDVMLDAQGLYDVVIGVTTGGLPADAFSHGVARWLGVEDNGAASPRVRLLAVPYAVAAAEAAMLGGKTAKQFVTLDALRDTVRDQSRTKDAAAATGTNPGTLATVGRIAMFASSGGATGDSTMIEASSNIGIGTAPGYRFQAHASSSHALIQFTNAATGATAADGAYFSLLSGSPTLRIMNQENAGIEFFTNNARRMTIDGSGRIGIGTPTPSYSLQVHGASSDALLQLTTAETGSTSSDGAYTGVLQGEQTLRIANQENGPIEFYTSQTPSNKKLKMRLATTGALETTNLDNGNTAMGARALNKRGSGANNTAVGDDALTADLSGHDNTGIGYNALASNTSGSSNTAVGANAMASGSGGDGNVALGESALTNGAGGSYNTAVGRMALGNATTGSNNIAIGRAAGQNQTTGSDNIYLGHDGVAGENSRTRVGTPGTHTTAFVSGIRGVITGADAVAVGIDSNGQLGTVSSSWRFKKDIRDMGLASRTLLRLRPVTFRYLEAAASGSTRLEYGLIAEDVAAVFPDLVVRDALGRPETVKYQKLSVLLLNEIQEQAQAATAERRALDEEDRALASTQAEIEAQGRQIDGLLERLQALEAGGG